MRIMLLSPRADAQGRIPSLGRRLEDLNDLPLGPCFSQPLPSQPGDRTMLIDHRSLSGNSLDARRQPDSFHPTPRPITSQLQPFLQLAAIRHDPPGQGGY